MTDDLFARDLDVWLREDAEHRVADHLGELLATTTATRQRRWWSSPGRWLPVDNIASLGAIRQPRTSRLIVVAIIVAALIVVAVAVAGSRQRAVPPPFGPARNGTITFSRSGDIYTVDSIGGAPRLLIHGTNYGGPAFSRDGRRLLFFRNAGACCEDVAIMTANSDGSDVRQLVDQVQNPSSADLSPDGSELALAATYHGNTGIYLMKTDGSDVPHLLTAGRSAGWPMWRPPDAQELLYLDWAGGLGVYGVRPDGSGRHLIKDIGQSDGSSIDQLDPSLSADGRYLVYAEALTGTFRNHLLDLTTGNDRPLALGPAGNHELHGQLSPDGTKLLFHDIDGRVNSVQEMVAPIDGSAPAIPVGPRYPIVDGDAGLSQAFSPDGRTILISGRNQSARVVDATTGGLGRDPGWQTLDLPGWQRLAP